MVETAPTARRRYLVALGLSATFVSVCSMLIGRSILSPWWLSAPATALVLFVGLYPLRYADAQRDSSARPNVLSVVVTGLLSVAAAVVVITTSGDSARSYLLAGAAILGVWMIGAWWVGRR